MDAIAMLRRLVAFDTTSALSNLALIEWVADYLDGHGIAARLTYDDAHAKANLHATLGPAEVGGIVLSGHTDVVPVTDQEWASDPFTLTERDGRLHARGSADMKGFIAACLALVPEFLSRRLATPIHLAFSYDEEVGCLGVPRLIADVTRHLPRPRMVLVGEPTGLKLVTAHKGISAFHTVITGKEGHSSAPQHGANAIVHAAELVRFIAELAAEHRGAAGNPRFDPPYTSFNVGRIAGGTAMNIIPRSCSVFWECRPLPGTDARAIRARVDSFVAERLLPRLRAEHAAGTIETIPIAATPAFDAGPDSPAEALIGLLTGANEPGTAAFATEAGIFQQAGIPAVVCGPGFIEQAHQPNEFISGEQLEAGVALLRRVGAWAAEHDPAAAG